MTQVMTKSPLGVRGRAGLVGAVITFCCMLMLPVSRGSAQAGFAREISVAPVTENLYLLAGEGGNVAAYVSPDGVVLVDNMFYRNAESLLATVAGISDQPLKWIINTHQHDDHAGGNAILAAYADILAHENVRLNLSDIRQPYYEDTPGTPIGLPEVTFQEAVSLHLGADEVRARYFGRGHTNGDVVVYFPASRAIHTGDLFLARAASSNTDAGRPRGVNIYIDYAQGGSFMDWTATLDGILSLDFDVVIPGHGPVSTRADLAQFREDLASMRERIAGLVAAGASRAQILAVFEADYGWRSTGCPLSPPTPGCLQFQQMDALIEELRNAAR